MRGLDEPLLRWPHRPTVSCPGCLCTPGAGDCSDGATELGLLHDVPPQPFVAESGFGQGLCLRLHLWDQRTEVHERADLRRYISYGSSTPGLALASPCGLTAPASKQIETTPSPDRLAARRRTPCPIQPEASYPREIVSARLR